MNERIFELAEQAEETYTYKDFTPNGGEETKQSKTVNLEKFAELIALECAAICEKYADVLDPLSPKVVGIAADYFQGGVKSASRRNSAAIKRHFGVEE